LDHPEKACSPGAFVPMAEELGLIRAIDEPVFEAACARPRPGSPTG
jgi:EAL domain-containing protein (putative c-di-GMP-specific phosphodiesterase class I)